MKKLTKARVQKNLRKEENISSFKKVKVSVFALTLIHSSLPLNAFAGSLAEATSSSGMKTILGALNTVSGMSQQMQARNNISQTEIYAMQEFNKAQKDAQSKTAYPNVFPAFGCQIAPEAILAPNGSCSVQGQLRIPEQALALGNNVLNMYVEVGKNKHKGAQCLEDGLKSIEDTYLAATAKYAQMIAAYEANLKKVTDAQKKNLINIKELNALLNGGGDSISQDFKNTDFNKLMPASCVEAYNVNKIIGSAGLVGLKDKMSEDDRKAKNFRGNAAISIRNQIEADKRKIAQRLSSGGYDQALREDLFKGSKFSNLFSKARTFAAQNTTSKLQKVKKMLTALGVSDADLPAFDDPSFMIKVDRLASKSEDSFREKFILDCMTGSNAAAYSTTLQSSLKSFNHVKLGSNGDVLDNFQRAAGQAFNSPTSITSLDRTVNSIADDNIRMTVTNSSGKSVSKTVSAYYSDLKNECTAIFNGDLKPAGDVAKLETYRSEAKALKKEASELQDLAKRTIASDGQGSIMAEIDELIYNCDGQSVELNKCESGGVYDTGSESFCVTQAAACSENLATCSEFTANMVTAKTNELKQKSDLYNAEMQKAEDAAKAMIAQVQMDMTAVANGLYKKMFPNLTSSQVTALGVPPMTGLQFDKTINMDQPADENLAKGLLLKKDPAAFMADMMNAVNGNVENFKGNLDAWFGKQKEYLQQKIAEQNNAEETEIAKWQKFVTDCNSAIAEAKKAKAEARKVASEQAMENRNEQYAFCQKLRGLQEQGPGPGCDGENSAEKLYGDAVEIASVLRAQSRGPASFGGGSNTYIYDQINDYANLCASANQEGTLSNDMDEEDKTRLFKNTCASSGSTKGLLTKLRTNILDAISDTKIKEKVKKYLEKPDGDIPEDISKELNSQELINISNYVAINSANDNIGGTYPGKSICQAVNMSSQSYADTNCTVQSEKLTAAESDPEKINLVETYQKSYDKCIKDAKKDFEKNPLAALGISEAASTVRIALNPGIQDKWNDIGEKYNGTACAAINGSQYGSKGLIPGLMEKIQRDIASDGIIQ